ncbi:MAG: GNAT family N-acetyltransferase [Planctomycetaceae bacterium]|nr:GNAT family N-acetyltransferase [Planctomycetaceae bacterium]
MTTGQQPVQVTPVEASLRGEVLLLMYPELTPAAAARQVTEMLEADAAGLLSLEGLCEARCGDQRTGCVLTVGQPDGTLFLWPPAVDAAVLASSPQLAELTADELLRAVQHQLNGSDSLHAQCLLDPQDQTTAERFRRNGLEYLAELIFMQADPAQVEGTPPAEQEGIRLLSLADCQDESRFASVIERTWTNTLDCPGFNIARTGTQALASHRLSGQFDPANWFLLEDEGGDAGLVLLGDHPDLNSMELVYLGVVPEARGRGWGELLSRQALITAAAADRAAVFLAVDSTNHYAIGIYDECGFLPTVRRQAWQLPKRG